MKGLVVIEQSIESNCGFVWVFGNGKYKKSLRNWIYSNDDWRLVEVCKRLTVTKQSPKTYCGFDGMDNEEEYILIEYNLKPI